MGSFFVTNSPCFSGNSLSGGKLWVPTFILNKLDNSFCEIKWQEICMYIIMSHLCGRLLHNYMRGIPVDTIFIRFKMLIQISKTLPLKLKKGRPKEIYFYEDVLNIRETIWFFVPFRETILGDILFMLFSVTVFAQWIRCSSICVKTNINLLDFKQCRWHINFRHPFWSCRHFCSFF